MDISRHQCQMVIYPDNLFAKMGSTTHGPFGDQVELTPDKVIELTRSRRKSPEYKPRRQMPGELRVSVLQKPTPRLRPRLEESLAGLAELKMLREKQLQRIQHVRMTSSDYGQVQDITHPKDSTTSWYSPGSLTSISEEVLGDKSLSESSPSYASDNSLDSLDSDVSHDEQRGEKSVSVDVQNCLPFKDNISVDLQMTFPNPRYLAQRRASTQCIPHSSSQSLRPTFDNRAYCSRRRASFQSEVVLTKSANHETSSKLISDMKLNYNFPGPLHAVTRQYGSASNLSSSMTSQSPSTNSSYTDQIKDPFDVLRAWALEKNESPAKSKIDKCSERLAQSVGNDSCGEKQKEAKDSNMSKESQRVAQEEDSARKEKQVVSQGDENNTPSHQSTGVQNVQQKRSIENSILTLPHSDINQMSCLSEQMCVPDLNSYGIGKENRQPNKLPSDDVSINVPYIGANLDHKREQSFTSDYYGSVETIHSVQSLPVSRVPSIQRKQSTSSEGSPCKEQHLSNNRRHSLPCDRTLPVPSKTRSDIPCTRSRLPHHDVTRKPKSQGNTRHLSGHISSSDDEAFENTTSLVPFNTKIDDSVDRSGKKTNAQTNESFAPNRISFSRGLVKSESQETHENKDANQELKPHDGAPYTLSDEGYNDCLVEKCDNGTKSEFKPTKDNHNQNVAKKTLLETSL